MYKLQKQAKSAKKELRNIHIESEADNLVTVTLSAEQEVINIGITDQAFSDLASGSLRKETLQEALKKALNKALKKAQEIAAEKTKGLWQEMGIGRGA